MESFNVPRFVRLSYNKTEQLHKLQEWGLIVREGLYKCPKCANPLTIAVDNSSQDGFYWRCPNKKVKNSAKKFVACGARISLRSKTFFERSHLEIWQILGFVSFWVKNVQLDVICEQVEIALQTAVDWASFCREVVYDAFILKCKPLGGPGKTVEIDESKFGRRKYYRGHRVEGQWVFGGIERDSGRVFMVPVERRDRATLIPIIKQWVLPGTTIVSDFWRPYDVLQEEGYNHLKVNHSINFKDPESGACTNAIESSWRHAKAALPTYRRHKPFFPAQLAKYMFQKQCRILDTNPTLAFMKLAGELYSSLNLEHNIADFVNEERDEADGDDQFV